MFTYLTGVRARTPLLTACMLAASWTASADVITDANTKAALIVSEKTVTPFAVRTMATVQVSVFEAVNAITGRYAPFGSEIPAEKDASIDAAVAAATRTVLLALQPAQATAIEANYQAALALIADGPARTRGLAVGEQAAASILDLRRDDGADAPAAYRPRTTAGAYVSTSLPAVPHWGHRRPWLLSRGDQFRPGPPPALTSDTWARDFNEIKALGAKQSSQRTPEQTEIARFWETTAPPIYWAVVNSVANAPGRDVLENARLLAVVGMVMDDALIAVFDAKYTYNFWRPLTAIRNADLDSNEATAADPTWVPLIETPMHPEYPCAHCIISGAVGAVLEAELGAGPMPKLSSTSATADGVEHAWTSVGDFTKEVAEARICDGVHFRNSTEVGTAMGRRIGEHAVSTFPRRHTQKR